MGGGTCERTGFLWGIAAAKSFNTEDAQCSFDMQLQRELLQRVKVDDTLVRTLVGMCFDVSLRGKEVFALNVKPVGVSLVILSQLRFESISKDSRSLESEAIDK